MSLIYGIEPDFTNIDTRGKLIQLVSKGYRQINYIESVAEAVRGYHYHRFNHEAFYIIKGKIEIATWRVNDKGIADRETFELSQYETGDFFGIKPFVVHIFTYLENSALISFYDKGVELMDGSKDIWKVSEEDYFLMKGVRGGCI